MRSSRRRRTTRRSPGRSTRGWSTRPTARARRRSRGHRSLAEGTADREVDLLPYLDPDLAALAHAGTADLLDAAIARARNVDTALPDDADVSIAWPADELPDLPTASLADRAGFDALVVGPGELPAPGVLTYTPSGRGSASVGGEDVPLLVPDERLSTAFVTGVVGGPDEAGPGEDGRVTDGGSGDVTPATSSGGAAQAVTPATAGQDLLAELAVITRERPNDGRHLLVTMPRTWQPDPAQVEGQLDALEAAPWVRFDTVASLVDLPEPDVDRGTLPGRTADSSEVGANAVTTLREAVEGRQHVASMVKAPETILGDAELQLLAPTAVAWRADPVGRARVVQATWDATRALEELVTVQPPAGPINLTSTSGGLPVQVTNTLDQAVTVQVALRPSDRRLVADEPVTVTVEAASDVLVRVPVHAVQSADVGVTVELRTPDGAVLDRSKEFTVRVRADWERIGTAVLGGLLLIGLVVGLIRTVRRGRTGRRARPVDSGPDALSPEEHEEQAEEVPRP